MIYRDVVELELHGTCRIDFGKKINKVADKMLVDLFSNENLRKWGCLGTSVTLPTTDFDAALIFLHFIQHFYHGGRGLRQICDWTMYLHRHAGEIDSNRISRTIADLGMEKEWEIFSHIAFNYLGLDPNEMPFYGDDRSSHAAIIWASIRHSGNFGSKMNGKRDITSEPSLLRKARLLIRHTTWMSRHLRLSPPQHHPRPLLHNVRRHQSRPPRKVRGSKHYHHTLSDFSCFPHHSRWKPPVAPDWDGDKKTDPERPGLSYSLCFV